MKSKRSTGSAQIKDQNFWMPLDSYQFTGQTERNFEQIFDEIKMIKKQLKLRVTRNQFISSLSSKLSISQLASLSFANQKENINPNLSKNNQVTFGLKEEIKQLRNEINHTKSNPISDDMLKRLSQLKQNWIDLNQKLIGQERKVQRIQELIEQKEENEKKRLAEVEAYIYRKAERSEIDKLFKLNQLLVIQIQQAKKKVQESSKSASNQLNEMYNDLKGEIEKHQRQQICSQNFTKQMQYRLTSQQRMMSLQLQKILQILEQKQNIKEQNEFIFHKSLNEFHNKIMRIESEQNLSLKQLTTRVHVLELKEGQIIRSVKEVDQMKSQLQSFKIDVINIHERSSQVSVNVRQFCQTTVNLIKHELSEKFSKEIDLSCEQIMKKIFQLTSEFISVEQLNNSLAPLKEKQRYLTVLQNETNRKLDFLQRKQRQIEETIEEQIQKNEQRINQLQRQYQNCMSLNQAEELMRKCVKVEQLKEVGKQIEIKMVNQIKSVVDEQDKINQVICSECIMAKWFWNSGALKGGNLVSWDKQVVNTLPENFKWQKNQPTLIIRKGGYYRIEMGFYSKKKPTVQLIVNGQTIVSAVNTSSYVLHHSSGKLKDVSNSQISGLTYVDYLLLPDEARVAISYMSDLGGEGFLSIHRV